MQSASRLAISVSIPKWTLAYFGNVLIPRDKVQSGVKSRFKITFYRSNSNIKSTSLFILGRKQVHVAAPQKGSSYALFFGVWPLGLRFEKLRFPTIHNPIQPFGFELSRFSARVKNPISPTFKVLKVDTSLPSSLSRTLKINLNASDFERVAPFVILDSSHESIFKPNPLKAKLLKDHESNRVF